MKRMKRRKYRKLAKKLRKKKKARNKSLGTHLGFLFKSTPKKWEGNVTINQTAMNYSVEDIYRLVGRDDKVTVLTFNPDSEAYNKFGDSCTVVFCYDLKERESLETNYRNKTDKKTFGFVKVKPLAMKLSKDLTDELMNTGINSKDIQYMLISPWATENPFTKKRKEHLEK